MPACAMLQSLMLRMMHFAILEAISAGSMAMRFASPIIVIGDEILILMGECVASMSGST